LSAMLARGLLTSASQGARLSYRAGASTAVQEAMVCRLLRIYRAYPVTTIRKVYEQARDPLRDFADKSTMRRGD
jgi:hypothetical protein